MGFEFAILRMEEWRRADHMMAERTGKVKRKRWDSEQRVESAAVQQTSRNDQRSFNLFPNIVRKLFKGVHSVINSVDGACFYDM